MKIFREGNHVKTVPAKYEPVIDKFTPTEKTKRLSILERDTLSVLLVNYKLDQHLRNDVNMNIQVKTAVESFAKYGIRDVCMVNKRGEGVDCRITFFDGITIRVPYSVGCHYPKRFIDKRNEW